MSKERKNPVVIKGMEEVPFGPPPKEYNYRCSICGIELLVNEAVVDAGIRMAKFNKEYYKGYMPKVGCPGCNNYTILMKSNISCSWLLRRKRWAVEAYCRYQRRPVPRAMNCYLLSKYYRCFVIAVFIKSSTGKYVFH